ncbi:MAG: RIP metalloprotease RseP [Candidatus Hatepunaea meridiana]|nr:RIP metalloprotease RseP [Candidatus Hatepunaea meridiana]
MTTIISFIIVIGIIVFVHELGHFLAAKLSGVRVETFSLGFPPKMISKKIGETEYQLAWIPIGGFVKMTGMLDESFDDDYDPKDPKGFISQPLINKLFILVAGVLMNFLLGYFIYTGITWNQGVGKLSGTTVTMVNSDYPAADAGLQIGDRIVEINGETVTEWIKLTEIIRERSGVPTMVRWERGDSLMSNEIIPKPTPDFNLSTMETDTVGKIGIVGSMVMEPVGLFGALKYGGIEVCWILKLCGKSIIALTTGKAKISDLAGPIGIVKMSGDVARSGFISFLSFIAFLSINIGFLNILPIPMLDGGHVVFTLIEAAIRRPIPEKLKMNLMKAGFAALILLITVVSYFDIVRLFKG